MKHVTLLLSYLTLAWVTLAILLCSYILYLDFSGNELAIKSITHWYYKMFDGRYRQDKEISVGTVINKVQIGALTGNRKLEFGIKNITEEVLQSKDYSINPSAKEKIDIDIIYLDVLKTQSSFSVVHNNKEAVVIRLAGRYYKDDKLIKKATAEESAEETSMSTLLIDEGGKFNQQNLSSALKKACNSLVNKLLETK
ncbi:MAG: hypothetical protein EBR30_01820 [Cytophagia bacterium]|nr:hypothetical protein [Cytophagia bacterium]